MNNTNEKCCPGTWGTDNGEGTWIRHWTAHVSKQTTSWRSPQKSESSPKLDFSPHARWGSLDFNKGVPSAIAPHSWRLTFCQLVVTVGTNGPGCYSMCQLKSSNLTPTNSTSVWARTDPKPIASSSSEHAQARSLLQTRAQFGHARTPDQS